MEQAADQIAHLGSDGLARLRDIGHGVGAGAAVIRCLVGRHLGRGAALLAAHQHPQRSLERLPFEVAGFVGQLLDLGLIGGEELGDLTPHDALRIVQAEFFCIGRIERLPIGAAGQFVLRQPDIDDNDGVADIAGFLVGAGLRQARRGSLRVMAGNG